MPSPAVVILYLQGFMVVFLVVNLPTTARTLPKHLKLLCKEQSCNKQVQSPHIEVLVPTY